MSYLLLREKASFATRMTDEVSRGSPKTSLSSFWGFLRCLKREHTPHPPLRANPKRSFHSHLGTPRVVPLLPQEKVFSNIFLSRREQAPALLQTTCRSIRALSCLPLGEGVNRRLTDEVSKREHTPHPPPSVVPLLPQEKVLGNTVFMREWKSSYLNIERNQPAATADPITPATFGPIACISRKFEGSSF